MFEWFRGSRHKHNVLLTVFALWHSLRNIGPLSFKLWLSFSWSSSGFKFIGSGVIGQWTHDGRALDSRNWENNLQRWNGRKGSNLFWLSEKICILLFSRQQRPTDEKSNYLWFFLQRICCLTVLAKPMIHVQVWHYQRRIWVCHVQLLPCYSPCDWWSQFTGFLFG